MKYAWWIVVAAMVPIDSRADHRFFIEPSLQVSEVDDDNLNFSVDTPLRDRIRRVTPRLAGRFVSPRMLVIGSYGFDSEHFSRNRRLDDDRARERAGIAIRYEAAPRLTLSIDGSYLNTNTPADLNVDTGLGASRVRGQSLTGGSSARFRVSPRLVATVQTSSLTTNLVNGVGTRSQTQALILERHVTARDLFNIHYEHIRSEFRGPTPQGVNTQFLLGRWIREFGSHNRVTVQAGPRLTEGKWSTDFTAIVTHSYKLSSIAISFLQSQTTVVGYAGMVGTKVVQTKFSFRPNHRLTAYATPAMLRTTHGSLQGTVYRVAAGGQYALTPLFDADVAYTHERQNGGIDPFRADTRFSRATLSFGFTTHWNSREAMR